MVCSPSLWASLFVAARIVPASVQDSVGGLPFWIQIPLIVLLSDLGVYWIHRMFHAVPWLWRFHEMHHSSEELDWLAATRVHPVDQILTRGAPLLVVVALGFSAWSISVCVLLFHWQAFLVHSNVRIGYGPLRLLLVSPAFHHWHHSSDREARTRILPDNCHFWMHCSELCICPKDECRRRTGWTSRCRSVTPFRCCIRLLATARANHCWHGPNRPQSLPRGLGRHSPATAKLTSC